MLSGHALSCAPLSVQPRFFVAVEPEEETAPCPYRPARVDEVGVFRGRVDEMGSFRSRTDEVGTWRARPDQCR